MAMISGGSNSGEELMADINTTPLIDVMLVLLIMLIVTIPLTTHSLDMDLPAAGESPVRSEVPVVRLTVSQDGGWVWDGAPVDGAGALEDLFRHAKAQSTPPEVQIIPLQETPWEQVMTVLATAQQQGVTSVALAQPGEKK